MGEHFARISRLAVVMVIGALSVVVEAQVTTGDIVGTVTDSSGAVVPNAVVTTINVATFAKRSAATAANGEYTFNLLQPGTYSVTVEAAGFKRTDISGINLTVGARERVDAVLQVGLTQQTVEVNAATVPSLQTDSSSIQSSISAQALANIPLNGRNFINLVQLQPGVSGGNPTAITGGHLPDDQRQSSTVQANGQPDTYNNQMVDGLDNNERQQGLIGARPSVDSIAEVQVVTSNYSAQFGRTAGAVVNIITKSGTNKFYGSAFEYFRNDIFDSRDFFATAGAVPKPELRQNQFGFSFGGPIVKNKTFFFGAAEWFRQVVGQTFVRTVPTLFEQQNPGDFSDISGAFGGMVPSGQLSQAALNYFQLYPKPNLPGNVAGDGSNIVLNNFVSGPRRTQYGITTDFRIDHNFNSNNTVFAHYSYNPVSTVTPPGLPPAKAFGTTIYSQGAPDFSTLFGNIDGPSSTKAQAIGLGYVHVFTPNLLLDLKAGYNRINVESLPYNNGSNLASKFGIQNANLGTPSTSAVPTILFFAGPYAQLGDGFFVPLSDINNVYQVNGLVTYNHGAHSIKMGAGYIRRDLFYVQQSLSPQGGFVYFPGVGPFPNPIMNFLAGVASASQRANILVNPRFEQSEPSLFIQDDWRVGKSLTLNLGLRWEMFTPMTESHNYYSNFDPATLAVVVAGHGTTSALGVKKQYTNFSPRVGMAWSPTKNTVVRGGFGMTYFPSDYSGVQENPNPPFSYVCFLCDFGNATFPVLPLPDASNLANPAGTLSYRPPNFGPSHLFQFNLGIQHQFGESVFTLGYVGSIGRDFIWPLDLDRPLPPGPFQPQAAFLHAAQLPNVVAIQDTTTAGYSNFNSMLATYQRRLTRGLSVEANYAWARTLGTNSNPTTPLALVSNSVAYDYGNSSYDLRQRFVAIASYALPFGQNSNGAAALLEKGWQFNFLSYWQTGQPDTIADSLTQGSGPTDCEGQPCPNPGNAFINLPNVSQDRPNMTGNPRLSHPTISKWFDTSVFTPQIPGTPGSEPPNPVYGPHDRRADMSLFKQFAFKEGAMLEFQAECFNISNTPNFGLPNDSLGSPGFGQITATNPQENPREWQFGLRAIF